MRIFLKKSKNIFNFEKKIFACREIRDLKQLVLDKDGAVTGCQDQLGNLLQQEYHGVKVK